MNLLLDIGNTRVKWSCDSTLGKGKGEVKQFTYDEQVLRDEFDRSVAPDCIDVSAIYVSNVAGDEIKALVSRWAIDKFGIEPEFAESSREKCGLISAYTQAEQLGVDRFLAMIGARLLTDNAVVVADCGTATTVDSINLNHEFIGGVILPGLGLMRSSLSSGARGLAFAQGCQQVDVFSVDTESAILSGTVLATVGVIKMAMVRLAELAGEDVDCIITGGSGEIIISQLGNRAEFHPNLVLMGLSEYFRVK